jgi:DUF1680 family protein
VKHLKFATFAVACAGVAASGAPLRSGVIADKVAPVARPFPLEEVRLLDGPFKQAMQLDQQYLMSLEPDRLLHNFRVNAGLPSAAKPLGGWEAPDVELRGHAVGHYLSALALMYAATGERAFKDRADVMVAQLAKIQEAQARLFHPGYLSAFPESFFDRVEAREKVWAPYYTIHKIMAGLLDVNQLCGNAQALDVVTRMADWVKYRVDHITEEKQQKALETEHGGMNEVLANIYGVTGNADYLRTAMAFNHKAIFDPLLRHEDPLNGLHANTQFPKIIGAAREYELTGDMKYHDIATYFWDRVVHHRSYVTGGNSDGEAFFPEEQFSRHLGSSSAETCNTYNMLKLTRHIFEWSPSADAMDFYERGLFNHILPSQDPETGMVIYYCPLRPGAWKSFSTPDDSFWCCVGTGMENHTKYGDTIYFHDDRSLYVNLFIPSQLTWKEKRLVVRQTTRFPEEDTTHLAITADRPTPLAIRVRYPSWAQGVDVTINGKPQLINAERGSYLIIDRTWKSGDTLDVRLPMALHTEAMPDDPKMIAVMYGPIVLAGDLGRDGLDKIKRYGPSAPQVGRVKTPVIPVFVGDVASVTPSITPVAGSRLHFTAKAQPHDVNLVPFYQIVDQRYDVYWNVISPAEWDARKTAAGAAEARRAANEARAIDAVVAGDEASERAHAYDQDHAADGYFEGQRIREARAGWFSYQLKIASSGPTKLVCTYRGSEGRRRVFDVLVDGEKVASETLEYHPTEELDREYQIPESLTRGKDRVTVRFQAQGDATAGALLAVKTAGQ